MTASNRERNAIEHFVMAMHTAQESDDRARAARERLVKRTREEPERVLQHLDSLPEGVEKSDPLLQKLRMIAANALFERNFSKNGS